jgi:hypothetical protein
MQQVFILDKTPKIELSPLDLSMNLVFTNFKKLFDKSGYASNVSIAMRAYIF